MAESNDYLLVKADVLPEVFVKVMEAKRLLNSGKAVSVNEAVKMVSLSRSAYYKYKGYYPVHCFCQGKYPDDQPEYPDQRTCRCFRIYGDGQDDVFDRYADQ